MKRDDFLYGYQKQPRDDFRVALKEQLAAESIQITDRSRSPRLGLRGRQKLTFAVGFAALFILGVLFAPVGTDRTLAQAIQHWVAGLAFIETDSLPTVKPLRENEIVVQQTPQTYEVELAEAKEILPFLMPEWMPDGYEISAVTFRDFGKETAFAGDDVTEIVLTWKRGEDLILWDVVDREIPMLVYDSELVEEIDAAGTPVAKVRGMWDAEKNEHGYLDYQTYSWEIDGLFYHLSSYESALSDEEAISIIGSAQR